VSEDGLEALEHQLGGPVPAGLTRLAPAELSHLAGAVQAARRRQAAELHAAGEQALGLVPRLLRGPIRRVIG
jgi:hypothetical protein